ncbi:hypothetical protein [Luteolibacter sp. AS25]|uniref:hypothetical protein n=1 Tax=Luteolibacter sp. AS25 TaxID=3135776 RepID=UPI00398A9E5C
MAKKDKDSGEKKGGCLGKLFGLIFFLILAGLGAVIYFIAQPQDLSDLGGYSQVSTGEARKPRDIQVALRKAIEGDFSVNLSEEDINLWLEQQLKARQGGELGEWITLKRVWVRLGDGIAEVIIERDVLGHALTTSLFVQVEQRDGDNGVTTEIHLHGGPFHDDFPKLTRGGRFGKVVVPQGFLLIVLADFRKLAETFDPEIELGFQRMARIKIEEDRLILDPQQPTSTGGAF